jgi:hypothetical protein
MVTCEVCDKAASVHITETDGNSSSERNFCQEHGAEYLGPDSSSQFAFLDPTSISPRAHERLERLEQDAGLSAASPTGVADPDVALPIFIELLNDDEPLLRYMAIKLLARLGSIGRPALPDLRKATTDPNKQIRDMAIEAIALIDA